MKRKIRSTGLIVLAAAMSLSGTAVYAEGMPKASGTGTRADRVIETETEADTEALAKTVMETEDGERDAGSSRKAGWTEMEKPAEDSSGRTADEDLHKSMNDLAQQIEDLTAETKNLRGQIEEIRLQREEEAAEQEAVTEAESETEQPEVQMDENKFLKGIRKSIRKRTKAAVSYSESELGAMTNDELVEANAACCEAERPFYEKYKNAVFNNKDVQYLCGQYIAGLKNQFDAYDVWKEEGNISLYNELWDAGYAKRACAVCELAEQYEIDFGDITEMQKKVEALNKKNGETPGTELGSEAVLECQNCLNTLGFRNTADGSWGARTSKMVKRFQLMYGYGPVDGILTEDVLNNLRQEAAKVAPPETEAQTEAQTETAS